MKTYKKKSKKIKKKKKTKKTKKNIYGVANIVPQSPHIKKIANITYSEYLQSLIDRFDREFFDKYTDAEVKLLPPPFAQILGHVLKQLGQYIRWLQDKDKVDLTTISTKKMYELLGNFVNIYGHKPWFINKKTYDTLFFIFSYVNASTALDNRDLRKAYGLSKGFFG